MVRAHRIHYDFSGQLRITIHYLPFTSVTLPDLPASLHGLYKSRIWDKHDVAGAVPDNWDK
jgi:hypothetical protein